MALSLKDIKKNKVHKFDPKQPPKVKPKKKTSAKTKPWERPKESHKVSFKELNITDSDMFKKALKWSKKIRVFPEIDIPVPDFLLTKDED